MTTDIGWLKRILSFQIILFRYVSVVFVTATLFCS